MEVVVLIVFISLILTGCSVYAFVATVQRRDLEHTDRLALAPLADETAAPAGRGP